MGMRAGGKTGRVLLFPFIYLPHNIGGNGVVVFEIPAKCLLGSRVIAGIMEIQN